MVRRIHIFGASGSGTTTLGKALAEATGFAHLDTDDFFWLPTAPPFTTSRERVARQTMLRQALERTDRWILSGSLCGWGDFAISMFDLAVFLLVPEDLRFQRLRLREIKRYGSQIESPSNPQYQAHQTFLKWAAAYNTGGLDMRSKAHHEQWIESLPCPVIRIEGDDTLDGSLQIVLDALLAAGETAGNS